VKQVATNIALLRSAKRNNPIQRPDKKIPNFYALYEVYNVEQLLDLILFLLLLNSKFIKK